MSAVLPSSAMPRAADRSEGVWSSAWRRFRSDRVGLVSLAIVIAFLVLIALSAMGLVAGHWQREVGVPYANPSWLGPTPPSMALQLDEAKGAPVDLTDVDPLAPRYAEWTERASKLKVDDAPRADTLPLGGDRLGRDVLAKAIKGAEISIFVGVLAALLATAIGTLLGAVSGFLGGRIGDLLEWVYNVFTSIPGILLIFAFAAVFGRGTGTVVLILGLNGWTGIYRLVRAEFLKHRVRDYAYQLPQSPCQSQSVAPHIARGMRCLAGI